MMKINIHPNGDIEFPEGLPLGLVLRNFYPDQSNPNLFHPKFERCSLRVNKCRMSPCGKRPIFEWWCNYFKKNVTCADCKGCDAKQEFGPPEGL